MDPEVFSDAARRAARFIVSSQSGGGAAGVDVASTYKLVWPLAFSGYAGEATRLLNHLKAQYLTDEGEFVHHLPYRYVYPDVWLLIGAHALGRFDVSLRVHRFLSRNQADNGGFACSVPAGGPVVQDMLSTSMGGLACIYMNDLERARAAASWLEAVLDAQPEPRRLFMSTRVGGELVTEFAPERSFFHLVDLALPGQPYFAPGAAIALLTKLHQATGDPEHIALARRYFGFAAEAPADLAEGLYDYPTGGKFGWGSAWLYRATGEARFGGAADRIASYLVRSQKEDGRWPPFRGGPDPNLAGEFCMWLIEIAEALS